MTFTRLSYYNNQVSSRENKNNTAQAVAVIVHHEFEYGILAQLGEHLPYKQRVIGSSPIGPIDIKEYGEIAQLARAHGSYPWCREFESPSRYYMDTLNRGVFFAYTGRIP